MLNISRGYSRGLELKIVQVRLFSSSVITLNITSSEMPRIVVMGQYKLPEYLVLSIISSVP